MPRRRLLIIRGVILPGGGKAASNGKPCIVFCFTYAYTLTCCTSDAHGTWCCLTHTPILATTAEWPFGRPEWWSLIVLDMDGGLLTAVSHWTVRKGDKSFSACGASFVLPLAISQRAHHITKCAHSGSSIPSQVTCHATYTRPLALQPHISAAIERKARLRATQPLPIYGSWLTT